MVSSQTLSTSVLRLYPCMDQEAQADNEAETMDCPMEYAGERPPMLKSLIVLG